MFPKSISNKSRPALNNFFDTQPTATKGISRARIDSGPDEAFENRKS
jgi:hypothetical protein